MPHPLLDCETVDQPPETFLRAIGAIFAEFGENTQDSGNVSYGVQIGADRYFVKTAGDPENPRPYLAHPARVGLLRNAVRLAATVHHSTLPPLLQVIESPVGPMLVYPWLKGELLGVQRTSRDDPASAFQRFRHLPASDILAALDAVYSLHEATTRAGWIAADFYDGCLLYDFEAARLWIIDLDTYHPGPFTNEMGRMFGSDRFMAPEEFERGARIDEQTTVFTLGRMALVFLSDGTRNPAEFRGSPALFEVVAHACADDRTRRFDLMAAFHRAWQSARNLEKGA